ncbi:tectonin beta-propeller repeat-containing protein-like isoform X1 [Tigriopus californicus]|uniref:tectonin beta-propeller repeat-containing protein-like isoform X1 n=1 Tax=Tigriopus californicus TaxID=6832 RepID=UPI0027D9FE91|nr:tectonin beta-propeller repeat-containing protein-like isoform X1 [Tigriopus californicus]
MIPNQTLFGVNSSGRVLYLGIDSPKWLELPYVGLEFKRVSSGGNTLWALGGDHQIYVFVFGVEVPIRVQEHTYENQRWNPVDGFCNSLLPTDRPNWSSKDGLVGKPKDQIKLPSLAWQWEGEWYVDTHFNGKALDKDAWTYSIDFPSDFSPKKGFTSCVRRRKWIRYRRYAATNSWASLPAIHKHVSEEPFIDVSVGGQEIPNGEPDETLVWAVTVLGRVFVRQGVRSNCPEGTGWLHITTPNGCEVSQISVSPSGLVWAVTWNGKALVRLGVSRINPTGMVWSEVESPDPSSQLSHICVGESAVWALSRDRQVWFRNGIRAASAKDSESLAKGSKWIEMVGELQMLSLGPGDQVMGITDDEDHQIVLRTGVNPSDLSGKTWKAISATPIRPRSQSQSSTASSNSSAAVYSDNFAKIPEESPDIRPNVASGSSNTFFKQTASKIGESVTKDVIAQTAGIVAGRTLGRIPVLGAPLAMAANKAVREEIHKIHFPKDEDAFSSTEDNNAAIPVNQSMYASAMEDVAALKLAEAMEEEKKNEAQAKVQRSNSLVSGDLILDREDRYGFDDAVFDTGLNVDTPHWVWITAGSCKMEQGPPKSWLVDAAVASSELSLAGESWRVNILQQLRDKNQVISESDTFKHYNAPIERTSWIKKAMVKAHSGETRAKWESSMVELEQTGNPQGGIDFGTLSIFGTSKRSKALANKKMHGEVEEHLSLFDITCVCQSGDKTLTIHTAKRSLTLQPLQIKFSGDLELEEWQREICHGMNSVRGIDGPPSKGSTFSVTARGEVTVFDPKVMEEGGFDQEIKKVDGQFSQTIAIDEDETLPLIRSLENGFIPGTVMSFTLLVKEQCKRFSINLQTGKPGLDSDVALHLNPRIELRHTVLNSKKSGVWGEEEKLPLAVISEDGHGSQMFIEGRTVQVIIKAEPAHFLIFVNGTPYAKFKHRLKAEDVTHFRLEGDVVPKSAVYHSKSLVIPPNKMYWRILGGGHFLEITSSQVGVTWALGYDSVPWVYTGGWGGAHFQGVASSKFGINPIEDTKYMYIYENQRWNPVTGFTANGLLPTDRNAWSDRTGKIPLPKESIKVPSLHWQWISDWLIDYTTPGGLDHDGWQYATDFPASYHGKLKFTDYVRRRRWTRKCRLQTHGPWKCLGSTKLICVTMQNRPGTDAVDLWAIASNGDALLRQNVHARCPEGTAWTHVSCDVPFQSISMGEGGKLWAIGNDGHAYFRIGLSQECPSGQTWLQVQKPGVSPGSALRQVSVGHENLVWVLDQANKLYLRMEVTRVFPEGTCWHLVCADQVKSISAHGRELWATLDGISSSSLVNGLANALQGVAQVRGIKARRSGITPGNLFGSGWDIAVGGGWKQVTIRGKTRE